MVSEKMYELGSKKSAIRELFEYGKQRAAIVGKENVYDFSLGNPTVPAPKCVKEAILNILETEESSAVHGYTSAPGNPELREGIAEYLNKTYDLKLRADNLYMTCGAAASLCICFKAFTESESDEFIVIAPFFPEYRVFAKAADANVVVVPPDMDNFQINMEGLESAINKNTKGIIVNSPNNPSGVIYTEETIKKLCGLLRKKSEEYNHPVLLISDEPYREIAYDNKEVPYLSKYYDNTIICYSYSKSLSLPGDRIGYIIVPDEVYESRKAYDAVCGAARALGYVCAPSMFQKVVYKCIGQYSDMNVYKENRDLLYCSLSDMGYSCIHPDGAFYLFVKALEEDSESFCEKAKEFDLLLVAGDDFGCPGYVRISYCVDKAMIERSLDAFKRLAEAYGNNF